MGREMRREKKKKTRHYHLLPLSLRSPKEGGTSSIRSDPPKPMMTGQFPFRVRYLLSLESQPIIPFSLSSSSSSSSSYHGDTTPTLHPHHAAYNSCRSPKATSPARNSEAFGCVLLLLLFQLRCDATDRSLHPARRWSCMSSLDHYLAVHWLLSYAGAISRHASVPSRPSSSFHPYSRGRPPTRGQGSAHSGRGNGRGGKAYGLDLRAANKVSSDGLSGPSSLVPPPVPRPVVPPSNAEEKEAGEVSDSPSPPRVLAENNAQPSHDEGNESIWVKKTSKGGNMSLMTAAKKYVRFLFLFAGTSLVYSTSD